MNEGELNAYEFGDEMMYELASSAPESAHAVADFLGNYVISHAAILKGDLVSKYAHLKKMAGGNIESFVLFQRHFIWCLGFLLLKLTPATIAGCEKEEILEFHLKKISAMNGAQLQQFLENVFAASARQYAERYAAREKVRDKIHAMQDQSSISEFIPAATSPQNFHLLKHMGEQAEGPIFPTPAPFEWYAPEARGVNDSPFLAAMERFQMVPETSAPASKLQHIEGIQDHTRTLAEFYQAFLSPELLDAFPLNRRISWEVDELGPASAVRYSFVDFLSNQRKAIEDLCAELVLALRAELRGEKFADAPRPVEPLSMQDFFYYLYSLKELCAGDFFSEPQDQAQPPVTTEASLIDLEKKRAEAFMSAQQKLNRIRHWLVGVRGVFRGVAPVYEGLDPLFDPRRYQRKPYGSSPLVYGYHEESRRHALLINKNKKFPMRIQWAESDGGRIQEVTIELFQLVRPSSLGGPIAMNLRLPVAQLKVTHEDIFHITDGEHPGIASLKRYVEITIKSSPWWRNFVQAKKLSPDAQRAFVSYASYGLYQLLAYVDAHEKDIARAREYEAAKLFKMPVDGFTGILNRFSFSDFQGGDSPAASPQKFDVPPAENSAEKMTYPMHYSQIIAAAELLDERHRIPQHIRGFLSPQSPLFDMRMLSNRKMRKARFNYLLKEKPSALHTDIERLENTDCGDLNERLIQDVCIKTIEAIREHTPPETVLNWIAYIGNKAFAHFIKSNPRHALEFHEKIEVILSRECLGISENYHDRFPQLLTIYRLYYFGAALFKNTPGAEAFVRLHARVSQNPPADFKKLPTEPPKLKVSRFDSKLPGVGKRMKDVMLIYPQLALHLKTCFEGAETHEKRAAMISEQYERFPSAMNFFVSLLLKEGKAVPYLKFLMEHEVLEYGASPFTREDMSKGESRNVSEKAIQTLWLSALKHKCSFASWIPPQGVEKTAQSYVRHFRDIFVTIGIFEYYDSKIKKIQIEKMPATSFARAVVAALPQLQDIITQYMTPREHADQHKPLARNALELFADFRNVCPGVG